MQTSDFDYALPPERIAQTPASERSQARMMVLDRERRHRCHVRVCDLPGILRRGDLLVLNDTRVIPARVRGTWCDTGGAVELLLIEDIGQDQWRCLCRSGRHPRPGLPLGLASGALRGEIRADHGNGEVDVAFASDRPLMAVLEAFGCVPLPPYIRREKDDAASPMDRERYQTVYARCPGAVAAPTAGLHFTEELFAQLSEHGVETAFITLHVGPGTFRPVTTEGVASHVMDAERYQVSPTAAAVMRQCRLRGGRIVAVGSTTVRTLETMAILHGGPVACAGQSRLFIHPPFTFRLTDAMLTNFHLPRSTLLMMVAALAGREIILEAYREAVQREYRFYSYGDCMLIV